jgi:hypothetical protein
MASRKDDTMSNSAPEFDLRYDFSSLSKKRLRVYNMLVEELEHAHDVNELADDDLDMLSAAGDLGRSGRSGADASSKWQ